MHALRLRENVAFIRAEEGVHRLRAVVEHGLDVAVARRPYVFEELAALLLGQGNEGVAQLVQSLAQRRAPGLVQARLAAVAAAIRAPALHAVRAAPGGVFDNFHSYSGGNFSRKLP